MPIPPTQGIDGVGPLKFGRAPLPGWQRRAALGTALRSSFLRLGRVCRAAVRRARLRCPLLYRFAPVGLRRPPVHDKSSLSGQCRCRGCRHRGSYGTCFVVTAAAALERHNTPNEARQGPVPRPDPGTIAVPHRPDRGAFRDNDASRSRFAHHWPAGQGADVARSPHSNSQGPRRGWRHYRGNGGGYGRRVQHRLNSRVAGAACRAWQTSCQSLLQAWLPP